MTRTKHSTNLVDYFKIKHGLKVDPKEPVLLVTKLNRKTQKEETIHLPTSLCRVATLPKDFTSDSRKMKDLQEYKLNNPEQRYERINTLI